jgi:hypothetical protein
LLPFSLEFERSSGFGEPKASAITCPMDFV